MPKSPEFACYRSLLLAKGTETCIIRGLGRSVAEPFFAPARDPARDYASLPVPGDSASQRAELAAAVSVVRARVAAQARIIGHSVPRLDRCGWY